MTGLTVIQHNIVAAVFSFMAVAMALAAVYFAMQRSHVQKRHQLPLTLLTLVTIGAAYSYFRLHDSWMSAYVASGAFMRPTGAPFNEWYRHTSWLLTVPLVLMSVPLALELPARQARSRGVMLALLGLEMIALGFPGFGATTTDARLLWLGASAVPTMLIFAQLFGSLGKVLAVEPGVSQGWMRKARATLVLSWTVYPAVYSLPFLALAGITLAGANVFMWTQVAYAAADLAAKAVFGVLVCSALVSKAALPEALTRGPPPRAKPGMSMSEPAVAARAD